MLIVIEGPDGSGKTTLLKQLNNKGIITLPAIPREHHLQYEMFKMYAINSVDKIYCIDRCFITEWIYRCVKNDNIPNITLEDIAHDEKQKGFYDMMRENNMTLDEMVVLQQYSKAIIDRDTRSAEFIRDTAGEKPSTQIDLSTEDNGLSKMSLEELRELKSALLSLKNQKDE